MALKFSHVNSSVLFSDTRKVFPKDRFNKAYLGPRMKLWRVLPSRPMAWGATNAAGLNHSLALGLGTFGLPTRSGRTPHPVQPELKSVPNNNGALDTMGVNGSPE